MLAVMMELHLCECHSTVIIEGLIHVGNNLFTNGTNFVFRIAKQIISLRFIGEQIICYIYKYKSGEHNSKAFDSYIENEIGSTNNKSPNIIMCMPNDMQFKCCQLLLEHPENVTYTIYINSLPELTTDEHNCVLVSCYLTCVCIEDKDKLFIFMKNTYFEEFYQLYCDSYYMSRSLSVVQKYDAIHAVHKGDTWTGLLHICDGIFLFKESLVCRVVNCLIKATPQAFEAFLYSNECKDTTLKRFRAGMFFKQGKKSHNAQIYDICNLNISIKHNCSKYQSIATPIHTSKYFVSNYSVSLHIEKQPLFKISDVSQKTPSLKFICYENTHWILYRISNGVQSVLKEHKRDTLTNIYKAMNLIKNK
jgi:hypothetical protein